MLGQFAVEHIKLALGLHREAVDRVFDLERGIVIEVPEAAAEIRGGALQPEQPVERLGPRGVIARQELPELLREVEQDRAGLEHPHVLVGVIERRNLGVRVDIHEAATELVAVADP